MDTTPNENSQNLLSWQIMNATQSPRNVTNKQKRSEFSATQVSRRTCEKYSFLFPSPSLFTITPVLLICSTLLSTQRCSVLGCLSLQSAGASISLQMQLSNIENVYLQPECVIWTYPLKIGGYFEFTLTSFVCNKVILLSAG